MHKTHPYILNPEHKITIALIGCGGTGSQVLTALARLNEALVGLGHIGIYTTVYDGDDVDDTNIGRQLFSSADIGHNKAVLSVSRINRYFGYDWEANPHNARHSNDYKHNIIISCIDSAAGRVAIHNEVTANKKANEKANEPYCKQYYWLDFGNDLKSGQAIIGTIGDNIGELPTVIDHFPAMRKMKEKVKGPSCSVAQALGKQDLFINSTLAHLGMNLIWKLFREGGLKYRGLYLNLETLISQPIKIK